MLCCMAPHTIPTHRTILHVSNRPSGCMWTSRRQCSGRVYFVQPIYLRHCGSSAAADRKWARTYVHASLPQRGVSFYPDFLREPMGAHRKTSRGERVMKHASDKKIGEVLRKLPTVKCQYIEGLVSPPRKGRTAATVGIRNRSRSWGPMILWYDSSFSASLLSSWSQEGRASVGPCHAHLQAWRK